jgi:hypothetical protein
MRGRALAVLMSTYYGVLGIAMAAGGILVDATSARIAWAVAGGVYLLSTALAFALARATRRDAARAEADASPPSGLERIRTLMGEIDETRSREREAARSDVVVALPQKDATGEPVSDFEPDTVAGRSAQASD